MGEIPTLRQSAGVTSTRESAFAAIELVRSGEFRAARSIVEAELPRSATDPYVGAAALHLGRLLDDAPLRDAINPSALWQAVVRGGSQDAVAFFGGAYAQTIGEPLAAREVLAVALRSGGSLEASIETILVAAELGDRPLRARALAKIEPQDADAVPGLHGVFEHARALAERAGGGPERAREFAARARLAYVRAGWAYYAARADELSGNERAAEHTYRRLRAVHDLNRLAGSRTPSAAGNTAGLSPREREVADLVAAGFSNKAIAERLRISAKTVEKNITAIYDKLGVSKRVQLAQRIAGSAPARAAAGSLPEPLTPFIGRAEELAELQERLARNRLVSLVGAGGSGKSRLATEFARRERSRFPDGTWFVDLAALGEASSVLPALAGTLGVRRDSQRSIEAAVFAWLENRTLLLVLDNAEHLLPALARSVRALLDAAPNLRLVATSRQRVGVFGENVFRVGAMREADGIAFFRDRAQAAGTAIDDDDLARRVCARLDGIPLAIELAAARLCDLTLQQLAGAIEERVPVLRSDEVGIGSRHRSIDALVDWAYEPLAPADQSIFRHAAVFAGTLALDTAVHLFGPEANAGLAVLHRTSLIDRLPSGAYRMLYVVRDVALAKLRALGEERDAFVAFAAYYDALLATANAEWFVKPIAAWLEPLRAERHNILAAIDWCLEQQNDVETGIRMTANAARIWSEMGREPELEPYLDEALRRAPRSAHRVRAQLWRARAIAFDNMRAQAEALDAARRALEEALAGGDDVDIALAHLAVGAASASMQDAATARSHLETALVTFSARGLKRSAAAALTSLAIIAGDDEQRIAMFADVLEAARSLDDALLEAITLVNLSVFNRRLGRVESARDSARHATAMLARLDAPLRLAYASLALARTEYSCGDMAAAVDAAGNALRYFTTLDAPGLRAKCAVWIAKALASEAPALAARFCGYADAHRRLAGEDEGGEDVAPRELLAGQLGRETFARLAAASASSDALSLLAEIALSRG